LKPARDLKSPQFRVATPFQKVENLNWLNQDARPVKVLYLSFYYVPGLHTAKGLGRVQRALTFDQLFRKDISAVRCPKVAVEGKEPEVSFV